VPIYDIGERDGTCFFSMKFIEGGQLDALVRQRPLSIREAAELIAKIARTVQYAHEHGVLHRDIKPGNILLDARGEPHLTDFGLARLVEKESNVTRTMDVLGTPSYMAPEQAAPGNAGLTSAADIYGIGGVLYQLLTSQPPFAGGTTYETIRLVIEAEPRSPRLWNAKIDGDLATICLKCLEKDPARRYTSALALAEDLERWLRHEPIRARRAGLITRSRKWVRRNRVVAAVAPVALALVSVVAFLLWKQGSEAPPPVGIAVLPFANLSDDPENAFLADALQDDILTKLATVADLKVISRTSVMAYRGERNIRKIGNALRVSHVLEGSVHRVDGRIRVNAQLIDARSDTHLWAETYERDRAELFAIETELAEHVARRLSVALSGAEKSALAAKPTQDLQAYELYSRGRQLMATASIMDPDPEEKALACIELFERAVARDPSFALAWCALADASLFRYWAPDRPPERLARAEEAVQQAVRLAPNAGETRLAQAMLSYRKLEFDRALEEIESAAQLLPNSAQVFRLSSWIERRMGRWREALRHGAKAVELDPRDHVQREDLIRDYSFVRRFREATHVADEAIAEFPEEADKFRVLKGGALQALGELSGARAELEAASQAGSQVVDKFLLEFTLLLYERNYAEAQRSVAKRSQLLHREFLIPDVCFEGFVAHAREDTVKSRETFAACYEQLQTQIREHGENGVWISTLALAAAALGRREEAIRAQAHALEVIDALERSMVAFDPANVYCWLGERERALDELEKAVKTSIGTSYGDLRYNPCWDSLRGAPRFEKILEEAAKPLAL
jgi:TolB-like protein/tetratricopeptide (TPR) repeat protein